MGEVESRTIVKFHEIFYGKIIKLALIKEKLSLARLSSKRSFFLTI